MRGDMIMSLFYVQFLMSFIAMGNISFHFIYEAENGVTPRPLVLFREIYSRFQGRPERRRRR